MNRFDFYTGDWGRDTAELSAEEEGVYLRLVVWYYANERPIPGDRSQRIARANPEITQWVLSRFFVGSEIGNQTVWGHPRIELEIEKARAAIARSRVNGKKGGRPRKHSGKSPTETYTENQEETQAITQEKPSAKPRTNPEAKLPSPSPSIVSVVSASLDKPKRATTRKIQLPADWEPKPDHIEQAASMGLDLAKEARKFRNHAAANARSQADWNAAFRNWLDNAQQFGQRDTRPHQVKIRDEAYARAQALKEQERAQASQGLQNLFATAKELPE